MWTIPGVFEQDRQDFSRRFTPGVLPMRRHEIKDEDWERIKDMLPGQPGDPGVTAKDNRLFINAVLWIAKTGAPWRDLPERFGPWGSVWKRFDRWAKKGVWERVFEALRDPDLEWMIIDSTVVRAHQHAAGAKKNQDGKISLIRKYDICYSLRRFDFKEHRHGPTEYPPPARSDPRAARAHARLPRLRRSALVGLRDAARRLHPGRHHPAAAPGPP